MFVVLSFIGTLPNYVVDCVHQIRCFFQGDIYLILNDLNSPFAKLCIEKYNIKIVNYDDVSHEDFNIASNEKQHKFEIIPQLTGREELYKRSLERFFLLQNLMKNQNLNDCLFIELDNLIYDDPNNWLNEFSKHELCYMYHIYDCYSSGIMYVKNHESLNGFLTNILNCIRHGNCFFSDMTCLARWYQESEENKKKIQIIPTYWKNDTVNLLAHENYGKYGDSIFDAASIGVFLLGLDPFHTNGIVVLGLKGNPDAIDYTQQKFEWILDEQGRKKPFIWDGEKWVLINNLHVHSKQLQNGLSLPIA